jgi:16S rRNA processing protein RimM
LSTKEYIQIGKILSCFGLKGLLKVQSSGDILPSLKQNSTIYLTPLHKKFTLSTLKKHQTLFLIELKGVESIDEAEKLIGLEIFIHKDEADQFLEKDEIFFFQLLGLHPKVKGEILKDFSVQEVMDNPAHPILIFKNLDSEILVPYIEKYIGEINPKETSIEVKNWEDWFHEDI